MKAFTQEIGENPSPPKRGRPAFACSGSKGSGNGGKFERIGLVRIKGNPRVLSQVFRGKMCRGRRVGPLEPQRNAHRQICKPLMTLGQQKQRTKSTEKAVFDFN